MSRRISDILYLDSPDPFIVIRGESISSDMFFLEGDSSRSYGFYEALGTLLSRRGFTSVALLHSLHGLLFFDDSSRRSFLRLPAVPPAGAGPAGVAPTMGVRPLRTGMMAGPLGASSLVRTSQEAAVPQAPVEANVQEVSILNCLRIIDTAFRSIDNFAVIVQWDWMESAIAGFTERRELSARMNHWRGATSSTKKFIIAIPFTSLEMIATRYGTTLPNALMDKFFPEGIESDQRPKRSGGRKLGGADEEEAAALINHLRFVRKVGVTYQGMGFLVRLLTLLPSIPIKSWFNLFRQVDRIGLSETRSALKEKKIMAEEFVDNEDIENLGGFSGEPARERLDALIGLSTVKTTLLRLQSMIQQNLAPEGMHMAFLGNPGTGKTTVARLFGELLRDAGVLARGHTVVAKRSDIIGQYVGQTAHMVHALMDKALDGVLFIDEAHQLDPGTNAGAGTGYENEALGCLVARMEQDRARLCVIMAGYTDPIRAFLSRDPGLQSRIPDNPDRRIIFPDYTEAELNDVFWLMAGKEAGNGFVFSKAAKQAVGQAIQTMLAQKHPTQWGNAREMRNLLDRIKGSWAMRRMDKPASAHDVLPEDIPPELVSPAPAAGDLDSILSSLDAFVGLGSIKDAIASMAATIQRNQRRGIHDAQGHNMVFYGNPGTGKTTVARLMGRIFHSLGITASAEVVELSAGSFVGQYVGQGPTMFKQLIDRSIGKVVFIDEAYGLVGGSLGTTYGKDIIDNVLIPALENYRDTMVFIFAGYPEAMETFLASNDGLKRRISHEIHFPDFSPEELFTIFESLAAAKKMRIPDALEPAVLSSIQRIYDARSKTFGNAGTVRGWVEASAARLALRMLRTKVESSSEVDTLEASDFPPGFGLASPE